MRKLLPDLATRAAGALGTRAAGALSTRAAGAMGTRAASALEFAIVGPTLLILGFLFLYFGIGLWDWNALQEAAFEAARCAAVSSPLCANAPQGCADGGVLCYAEAEAARRGVGGLTAAGDNVTYTSSATTACGGETGQNGFSIITFSYGFSILGYNVPLTATACFPNNPTS